MAQGVSSPEPLGLYWAKAGEPLAKLVPEGYALVREAAVRTIKQRHYDVQMIGGMALFNGCIAEMETGEGKTLTAANVGTASSDPKDAAVVAYYSTLLGASTGSTTP